eukprot:TRINITY_DN6411_c0_g1_i1.p1 TRINITY_DN6411_c0_g1~~TRINITY_DN6411_c0_g1_i1.p1  ORF type:complete len:639 (+),score=96.79 TRINITY_DN6411_c0_g1_i1:53-1918(+)
MASPANGSDSTGHCVKVAFQGEKGAYSEKAVFELLGRASVTAVPFGSFDDAFAACTAGDVSLCMVPIENSLGGTIHANCDLQLQNNLFIIAEHHLRVSHCMMALPGTKVSDLTKVISHPQALAQCDSYIKRLGLPREAAYDTAGSAKMISEGKLEGVCAICSELAAEYYGLEILDRSIEDDSNNFTRFLLLSLDPVQIPPSVSCKSSIVFALDDGPGALFKALSVFAFRDIDLVKIESRPCKPDIMNRLERLFWSMGGNLSITRRAQGQVLTGSNPVLHVSKRQPTEAGVSGTSQEPGMSCYRYLFYVDFIARIDEPRGTNAIRQLQELTTFFRVLGSYPRDGALVGLENFGLGPKPISKPICVQQLRVGLIGFGTFGQFISKQLAKSFDVFVTSRSDSLADAQALGVTWCESMEGLLDQRLDILIISVSILSFEGVMKRLRSAMLSSSGEHRLLVVDVLSVKVHAKTILQALLPETCDILCTHPMFGPQSGKNGWHDLPFVFERVRISDFQRCEDFLRWWSQQGCKMVDMSSELHDECAASSQFVTHLTGRTLSRLQLKSTPIQTKGFESLLQLVDNTCKDSFELFLALFKYNPNAARELDGLQKALNEVAEQLRAGSVA